MTDHSSLLKEKNNPDIVERLRDKSGKWINGLYDDEAAADITRLRAEAEALRKDKVMLLDALQAMLVFLPSDHEEFSDDLRIQPGFVYIRWKELRKARAAIASAPAAPAQAVPKNCLKEDEC